MARGFRRQPTERVERTTITPGDVEALSEATLMKILEGPNGVPVTLIRPDGKSFSTLLGGVPRAGDYLWMQLRQNSKPMRWRVEQVEWFVEWPLRNVEVRLAEAPIETREPTHRAE